MQEYTVKVYDDRTEWFQNGKRHRLDGPAIELANGHKEWWQNNERHRLGGPAVEFADGIKSWYIEGIGYTEEEFSQKTYPKQSCDGKIVKIEGVKYQLKKV
jgi:hypothetical protein